MTFSNFEFLRGEFPRLYHLANMTDALIVKDPFAAMVNIKDMTNEVISVLSKGNELNTISNHRDGLIHSLWKSDIISEDIYLFLREIELFDIHESEIIVDLSRIEHLFLRLHDFLVWFYKTYVDDAFMPIAFVQPTKRANSIVPFLEKESDDRPMVPSIIIDGIHHSVEWSHSLHTLANYGVIQYDNGEKYEGQLERGLKQGQGIYTWRDGTIYKGQWSKDLEHGYGEKMFANGDTYRGGWENGIFAGQGVYRWADGASYEGQWQDGFEHGSGIKTDVGGIKKEGFWTYGEYVYTTGQLRNE